MYRQHQRSVLFAIATMSIAFSASAAAADNNWPEGAPWPAWATAGNAGSQVEPVAEGEAKKWLHWVIPLPKRVRLAGKLVLPASGVALRLRSGATDVEQTALGELVGLITKKTGAEKLDGPFSILIGVCDAEGKIDGVPIPGADKLRGLKNDDQAYVIAPLPKQGIAVAALTERGVYHGVKTLQQLIEPKLTKGKLTMPIVAVLDWPDLAERGLWGGSAVRDIQYLADRKMNLIEAHTTETFDENGRGLVKFDIESQQAARLHAVKWVPIITHLDQLARTGILDRYPELKAKGSHARYPSYNSRAIALCFSEPKAVEILADWFLSLADTKGVRDINVWLSEVPRIHCECPKCKKAGSGQYAIEAAACVRAWQLTRKKHPDVRLRILLTQGSYSTNDKVLAAASPPEVGITYYDGSRTYDSSRDPMIYPLLADFAKKGRWLGCYPQLTASWRTVCPWSGPQFIKYRMTEFVDKGLECLCGYATPDSRFYDFNITAAAEWSWNSHGRSEREFSAAWATRRGLDDPDKVADWAVMLGPVGWDVYGSEFVYRQIHGYGSVANVIKRGGGFTLGKSVMRYFPTEEHIDADLAVCNKAMKLAEEINDPAIIAETRVIQGCVRMVKSLYAIGKATAGKKELDADAQKALQATFDERVAAGRQTTDALGVWKNMVAPDCTASRIADTVDAIRQTVTDIAAALAPFGIKEK